MKNIHILFSISAAVAIAAAACGGSTASSETGDASVDGNNSSGGSSSSSGSSSGGTGSGSGSGGTSSGSGSGGISSSSSSGSGGMGVPVDGGPVPCGQAVCNSPQICCESAGVKGGGRQCDDASDCKGISVGCTADTCPMGSLCCGSLTATMGMVSGATQCQTSCNQGQGQLCSPMAPCPNGEACIPIGGGTAGTGAVSVCRTPMGKGDGGVMPPLDAGAGD